MLPFWTCKLRRFVSSDAVEMCSGFWCNSFPTSSAKHATTLQGEHRGTGADLRWGKPLLHLSASVGNFSEWVWRGFTAWNYRLFVYDRSHFQDSYLMLLIPSCQEWLKTLSQHRIPILCITVFGSLDHAAIGGLWGFARKWSDSQTTTERYGKVGECQQVSKPVTPVMSFWIYIF